MAVTLNAAGTQATGVALSFTYSGLTIAAGSNIVLVVICSWISNPGSPSVNRWDSGVSNQNLSTILAATASVNSQYVAIYGLVAPVTGNKVYQLTWPNAVGECVMNAIAFDGADQTGGTTSFPNAASATGNNSSPSIAITLPGSGAAVSVLSTGTAASISSVSATQLLLYHGSGSIEAGGSYSTSSGTLTGTLSGTDQWVIGATGVAAASGGGGGIAIPVLTKQYRQRGMRLPVNPSREELTRILGRAA